MNTTRWTLLFLLTGCSATPVSNDAGPPDVAPTDALTCSGGQVPGYRAGCANPAPFCVPDESTDALALTYCGCDGANFTWNAATPRRPWSHAGPCVVDGGAPDAPTLDAPTLDAPTPDAPTLDAPTPDVTDGGARDGSLDAPALDVLTCGAGHVAGYDQGCINPMPRCADDTSGDAVALVFCGCDGTTFSTNQSPPLRPWSHWGSCTPDGGVDAVAVDLPSLDAPAVDAAACPLPPIDTAVCARDSDCATVARGCYCGRRPVVGVARTYAAAAARCEEEAASRCALGCPVMEGSVAQDGRSPADGGAIAVRCEPQASGVGSCRTYVP